MEQIKLPKQNNYETAYNLAAEALKKEDRQVIATRCGVEVKKESVIVPYFDRTCSIKLADVSFEAELPLSEKILILHYLTTTGGYEEDKIYISFKQLPGASFYNPTYRKRGPHIILSVFGKTPDDILKALSVPCVKEGNIGDVSIIIRVFPKIEVVVAMYRGDDEFPPECQFLYSDAIVNLLPLEDVAVLAGRVSKYLIKWVKQYS